VESIFVGDSVEIPRQFIAEIRTRITDHGYLNLVILSPDPTGLIQSLDWGTLLGVWVRHMARDGYTVVLDTGALVEVIDAP
jgi:hypothetical protein